MATEYKLSYTASEINEKLGKIDNIDHSALLNRDLPDQHPMSAITGLEKALANAGGGSGEWELLRSETLAEDVSSILISDIQEKQVFISLNSRLNDADNAMANASGTASILVNNKRSAQKAAISIIRSGTFADCFIWIIASGNTINSYFHAYSLGNFQNLKLGDYYLSGNEINKIELVPDNSTLFKAGSKIEIHALR